MVLWTWEVILTAKSSNLDFLKFPLANGGPPELPQKRTISRWACSVPEERLVIKPTFDFSFGILELSVKWIQQFLDFSGNFLWKFSHHLPPNWMSLVEWKILMIASFLLWQDISWQKKKEMNCWLQLLISLCKEQEKQQHSRTRASKRELREVADVSVFLSWQTAGSQVFSRISLLWGDVWNYKRLERDMDV